MKTIDYIPTSKIERAPKHENYRQESLTLAIRSTHGANRQGPLLQEGALVPLFTPRQTGKKLVSTPLEDKYIQTKTNKNHIVAFIFNN